MAKTSLYFCFKEKNEIIKAIIKMGSIFFAGLEVVL